MICPVCEEDHVDWLGPEDIDIEEDEYVCVRCHSRFTKGIKDNLFISKSFWKSCLEKNLEMEVENLRSQIDMLTRAELEHRFKFHPATGEKRGKHEVIRGAALYLANVIVDNAPDDSRERSLAITKVEEAMMWANAAIARHKE